MLKSYLARISEEIETTNFYVSDFRKEVKDHATSLVFKLEPRLFFTITESVNSHHAFTARYSSFDKIFPVTDRSTESQFDGILKLFETWLEEVTKYEEVQEEEDPWDVDDGPLLLSESFSQINFDEDKEFTESESKLLKEELNTAYDHIKDNIEVAPDRLEKIEEALKNLSNKIDQLSKNSWKATAKDILKDVIIDAAKDAVSFASLVRLFGNLFDGPTIFLS